MPIIRQSDYKEMPWKNGGGVTREIACHKQQNKMIWRLSIAEVLADGPFSTFEDHHRILTVIKGDGMRLVSEQSEIEANLRQPVSFDGSEAIYGYCKSKPIFNFNLIFDPKAIAADVQVMHDLASLTDNSTDCDASIMHLLTGDVTFEGEGVLHAGDTYIFEDNSVLVSEHSEDLSYILVKLNEL